MAPALAVIGAVASVGGTLASVNQQKKAARLQSQQVALQQRQQELATRRSQRQAIREAQLRRAQTMATAQGLGAATSSSVAGGIGSLGSQLGGSLGFASEMGGISGEISGLSRQIGIAQSKSNLFGAVAGLGGTAFQLGGGFSTLFPGSTATGGVNENLLKGIA